MSKEPLISVIIPVYNSEKYLTDTIESVLNQSYKHFELIAVNDGSTDSSLDILEELTKKESRIVIVNKENGGVSTARNLGLFFAKGEYLTFLDSDDLWLPTFLESMLECVLNGNKKVSVCGYTEERGHLISKFPVSFYKNNILSHLLLDDNFRINTNSWLIQKSLIDENCLSFYKGSHYGEDNEFFCKVLFVAKDKNIGVVDQYLTRYMFRQDSLSSRDKIVNDYGIVKGYVETLKRLYHWFKENNGFDESAEMQNKFKKLYIESLWDNLLLGTSKDYKKILHDYKSDIKDYNLKGVQLGEKKYMIWNLIISNSLLRFMIVPFARYLKKRKRLKKIEQL